MNSTKQAVQVLIIGAGPVGLVLACELRQQGVDVRIVDRRPVGHDRSKGQSRAILVWPRILEQLRRIGVSDRMVRDGHVMSSVEYYSEGTLRGAVRMDVLHDSPYPFVLTLSQNDTERILQERLAELGGRVDADRALTAIDITDTKPVVTLTAAQGDREIVQPDWLVAADGASSTARSLLGIDFATLPIDISYGIGDFEIDGPVPQTVQYRYSRQGIVVVVPLKDGLFRVAANIPHRNVADGPPPAELFDDLLRQRGKLNVTLAPPRWTSSFRPRCGVARAYRAGRCFLAGDAAHVVSPAGGQGMNLGLQDAVNLGWKLGGVVMGRLSETVLDGYHTERSGAAAIVGRTSAVQVRYGTMRGRGKLALRDNVFSLAARFGIVQKNMGPLLSQTGFSYGTFQRFDRVRFRDRPAVTVGDRIPLFAGPRVNPDVPPLALDSFTVLLSAGRDPHTSQAALLPLAQSALELFADVQDITGVISHQDTPLARALGPHPIVAVVRPDGHLAYRCSLDDAEQAVRFLREISAYEHVMEQASAPYPTPQKEKL
jgi:2-polyprenyl-6-methoxyphenol hydroxylase-like FAD-dependent oxidoreductase